jgi:heme-degrading monooxygenase HmoA
MTILREWRGKLRRHLTDEYVAYMRDTGLADYRATPGNLGALIAVRDLDDERAEVITLSWWPSMDAIRTFAGHDVDRAVYYPEDDRYLLTKPEKVQHYESHGLFDSGAPPG